ncbi:MAG: hypothetical protein WCV59_03210 [Parcubacteria group bacterium]|jgi:hypothetical protein
MKNQNSALPSNRRGSAGLIIVLFAAIIVLAIIVFVIIRTLFPAFDLKNPLALFSGSQTSQSVVSALKIKTDDSVAEIITGDGKTNLTLDPIAKKDWPKDAVGGMFKLEPSGDFPKPITFKMTLNKAPEGCFAIGYWHEDTKKWEFLPTIDLGNNQYATVLTHASTVGGGLASACPSKFQDAENVSMSNAIRAELMKIQIDQQTGEAAKINDASWKKAWENADELTNKVISDFCKERKAAKNFWDIKNTPATMDFFNGTQMMQCLGFETLAEKYSKAVDNECGEKKKDNVYVIKQTDNINANVDINLAQGFYKQQMDHKTMAVTNGKTTSFAKPGAFGWQTSWQVDSFYTATFTNDSRVFKEESVGADYYLLDIPMKGVTGKSNSVNRTTFSLEGVNEGQTFSVKVVPISYTSSASGPSQTARGKIIDDGQLVWNYNRNFSPGWSDSGTTGKPMEFKATLLKNLGEKGAIIKFSSDLDDLGGKQGEQLKQINDMVKSAMPGGQSFHGMTLPPGVNISESGGDKPWRIKLESDSTSSEDGTGNQTDSSKNNNSSVNPNDKDGDGVPDLAPLPSANDKNGDGIPDLVPLPSPNDLNGDGIQDLVPLPGYKK